MTQWYVKDLSQLTGVSVQTLHHYDRIGLLKPSVRLANGYRVYSERDLLQLQQIIALKFFGFELSQIKTLLTQHGEALEHFKVQAELLKQKADTLLHASNTLKEIVSGVTDEKSIPWETIIQLIEVYMMTQKLDHAWVKEIFTPDELKQYVNFEMELKGNGTPEQKAAFEEAWDQLVSEVKRHLKEDPHSKAGIHLGKKWMEWVNGVYGKKYAHLRTKIFEQGFGEGKGLDAVGLTPEIVSWVEKAMEAYWRDRMEGIFRQIGKAPTETLQNLWNELLEDMYGDDEPRKKSLNAIVLGDDKISKEAKTWLRNLSN